MKTVKKVLTLLLILTIISQIFIPSNVKAQNTIRTYDNNSLYDEVAKNAVLDNKRSEYVDSDTGIDFTKGASSTNGQGVYTIASTKDDLYPIHYYRGNIDNNNVLFGGFCWQIVRTTETGGVKLIYNGSPDENGKCESPEMDWHLVAHSYDTNSLYMYGTNIKSSRYNYYLSSNWYETIEYLSNNIEYAWNMHLRDSFYYSEKVEYSNETNTYTLKDAYYHSNGDSIEEIKGKTPIYFCYNGTTSCNKLGIIIWDTYSNDVFNRVNYLDLSNGLTYDEIKKMNILFGNDIEYENGQYELKNTISIPLISLNNVESINKILDGHHYFCDGFSNSCTDINYIYDYEENYFVYEFFEDGDNASNIYSKLKESSYENNSQMKSVIDRWYSENLIDDTKYLEDTIWCNDKSVILKAFDKNNRIPLKSSNYNENINLSFACSNLSDKYTVDTKNGNGKLLYPVATITAQEALYYGNFTDEYTATMTPYHFYDSYVVNYRGLNEGIEECELENLDLGIMLLSTGCNSTYKLRPMVSLKHSMVVSSGDGSPTNPYEVVEGNTVEYVIDGDMPNGFIPPEVESYLKGSKVKMNGLKAGDIINGYRFLGWQTKDVEVVDGAFDMPENKVVFVGRFEKIVDSPLTYDSISKYLTTGIIGVVGLAGFILLKKKI